MVDHTLVFKGDKRSPLLAPRGVWLVDGMLFVSDTAQNRVFCWKRLPNSEFASPDLTLGQVSATQTGRNAGGEASASSLLYPSGIWSDGKRLVVADAWNHRVLIWNQIPIRDGQAADLVIGQPSFDRNQPNVEGLGSPPSARSLNWPYGIHSDGQSLWIADTGNRRVLYYENWPRTHYAPADAVIGKASFEERDYDHLDAVWPYSVRIGPGGEMAITDTQYYRVLIWNHWKDALDFTHKADAVIGQESLEGNGPNQFGWFPKQHTLNWCYDTFFHEGGIWVADTGNSRVLGFREIPKASNLKADALIGQENFETGSENMNTIRTTENSLYWPFSICISDDLMALADTGNHRIVMNKLRR